jgi:hypothetical protein
MGADVRILLPERDEAFELARCCVTLDSRDFSDAELRVYEP